MDFTNVSTIPDDATLADSYYSTCDDFEDDSAGNVSEDDSTGDVSDGDTNKEYGDLVGCMQDALDLTESDMYSSFGDDTSSYSENTTTLRQQKIDSLKRLVCG